MFYPLTYVFKLVGVKKTYKIIVIIGTPLITIKVYGKGVMLLTFITASKYVTRYFTSILIVITLVYGSSSSSKRKVIKELNNS